MLRPPWNPVEPPADRRDGEFIVRELGRRRLRREERAGEGGSLR